MYYTIQQPNSIDSKWELLWQFTRSCFVQVLDLSTAFWKHIPCWHRKWGYSGKWLSRVVLQVDICESRWVRASRCKHCFLGRRSTLRSKNLKKPCGCSLCSLVVLSSRGTQVCVSWGILLSQVQNAGVIILTCRKTFHSAPFLRCFSDVTSYFFIRLPLIHAGEILCANEILVLSTCAAHGCNITEVVHSHLHSNVL